MHLQTWPDVLRLEDRPDQVEKRSILIFINPCQVSELRSIFPFPSLSMSWLSFLKYWQTFGIELISGQAPPDFSTEIQHSRAISTALATNLSATNVLAESMPSSCLSAHLPLVAPRFHLSFVEHCRHCCRCSGRGTAQQGFCGCLGRGQAQPGELPSCGHCDGLRPAPGAAGSHNVRGILCCSFS